MTRGLHHRGRALVWLVFILIPLVDALASSDSGWAKAAVIAGAFGFVFVFVALVVAQGRPNAPRIGVPAVALMLAIATSLTLADRVSWVTLLIYTASACAVILPPRLALGGVVLSTGLVAATQMLDHQPAGAVFGYTVSTVGVGMLMLALADLRAKNNELREARAELAKMAVAQERERFARDLHDLLGHSLSVIALKSELAGRLLDTDPDAAAAEIADVQMVARQSLTEVRDAVSGYHRPTLDSELEGARMALSAAGVRTSVQRPEVEFDPEIESVLAWAVREGATNVIRHSRARRCEIRIEAGRSGALLEICDDGVGDLNEAVDHGGSGGDGHGLDGLLERAASLGGRLDTGPGPDGGFRLALTLPMIADHRASEAPRRRNGRAR
ncbi:MAG: sensor histidine kinase [Solirubrobacteraceae bacterium]